MKIDIITDHNLIIPEYIIDIKNKSKKTLQLIEHKEKLKIINLIKNENKIINLKNIKKYKKKPFKKKNFFKKAK